MLIGHTCTGVQVPDVFPVYTRACAFAGVEQLYNLLMVVPAHYLHS